MKNGNSYADLSERERLVNKFIALGFDGRIDLLLKFYADTGLSVSVAKSVKTTNKTQIISSVITIIIVAATAYFSWQDKEIHNEELIIQKSKQQEQQIQKELQEIVFVNQNRIDSLYLLLDRLKTKKTKK